MAKIKFITVKGNDSFATSPYYIGFVQHERTMSPKEAYEYFKTQLGYSATQIRAANRALARIIEEQAGKGNISYLDGIASVRHSVKGSFESDVGPWVKGKNLIVVYAAELDPFKSALDGKIPENMTGGANPMINSVLDETTDVYDVLGAGDTVSIAGTDLAPDTTADDEYVALVASNGTETKLEITESGLMTVKVQMPSVITAGAYTLKVYTRSGFGGEFGVKTATRKVTVG